MLSKNNHREKQPGLDDYRTSKVQCKSLNFKLILDQTAPLVRLRPGGILLYFVHYTIVFPNPSHNPLTLIRCSCSWHRIVKVISVAQVCSPGVSTSIHAIKVDQRSRKNTVRLNKQLDYIIFQKLHSRLFKTGKHSDVL